MLFLESISPESRVGTFEEHIYLMARLDGISNDPFLVSQAP